jgi:DNA-directed RNA polymerase
LFAQFDKLFNPKNFDARGRAYSVDALSEQSEELIRASFSFAEKKRLNTYGLTQLKIYGASLFGSSKSPEIELLFWIDSNEERIVNFEKEENLLWIIREASKPLLFLRFCLEYKRYKEAVNQGLEFESNILIFQDVSCSGLSILSAVANYGKFAPFLNLRSKVAKDLKTQKRIDLYSHLMSSFNLSLDEFYKKRTETNKKFGDTLIALKGFKDLLVSFNV